MKQTMIALAVVLLCCSASFAAITPCATGQTLAFYVATYNSAANACQLDDKVFWGFADSLAAGGSASAAGVGITVIPDPTHLNPGFNFQLAGFTVSSTVSPSSLDLKLGFDVAVLNGGAAMEDVSLGIAGAQNSGTGTVSIGENVCVGGFFANIGAGTNCATGNSPPNEITLNVQNPGPPPVSFDMKLTTLTNEAGVFKDVSIASGSSGSASLSSFTQNFSEVPEPGSILLLGTLVLFTSSTLRRKLAR
jgi:hypothetical protein